MKRYNVQLNSLIGAAMVQESTGRYVEFDAAQSELAALREELKQWRQMVGAVGATIPIGKTLASMSTKQTMVDYFKELHIERDAATNMVRYLLPVVDPMAFGAIAKAEAFLNPDPVTEP